MPEKIEVLNKANKKVGSVDLNDGVYNSPLKESLIKDFVLLTLSNKRLGLASTKIRKFVSGGGIKPWKQKGTGRARAGSIRSPLFKGGGTIFGPTSDKNFKKDMPKKARKAALKSALSFLLKEGRLVFIEDFELKNIKTKDMKSIFEKLNVEKGMIIIPAAGKDQNIIKSTRNLKNYKAVTTNETSIVDLLKYEKTLITLKANEELERNLSI